MLEIWINCPLCALALLICMYRMLTTTFVHRKDGEDFSCGQAWAIAEYMQFWVADAFEDAIESEKVKDRRAAVKRMLTWKIFHSFLATFKQEMTATANRGPVLSLPSVRERRVSGQRDLGYKALVVNR